MNKTLNLRQPLKLFGIPLLLIAGLILLARSSFFASNPEGLSLGITVDLLITVPLVYFLLIRKTKVPNSTVISVLIVGMVVGLLVLPEQHRSYLELFKTWVFPVLELSVLAFVVYKVRQAVKAYKSNQDATLDFYTTLKKTCRELLPSFAVVPVVTEIAVFYYGFIRWKRRKLKENEFSYHKESGTQVLLIAILFIVAIETYALHAFLLKWSETAAWAVTFISVYTGFQLFGYLRSLSQRPISIENGTLFLRYGIMNETIVDIQEIESIELSSKDVELNKETRKLSFLGKLVGHNVILRLKREHTLVGLYGIKRSYKNLLFHVDDKAGFVESINSGLERAQ